MNDTSACYMASNRKLLWLCRRTENRNRYSSRGTLSTQQRLNNDVEEFSSLCSIHLFLSAIPFP